MDPNKSNIMVVDDQKDVRGALKLLFKGERWSTTEAADPESALKKAGRSEFSLAVIDLNYQRDTTSGKEGLKLLSDLRAIDETLPVIVMTAWGSIDIAVDAMRRGACDFIEKPWNNERLITIVRNQLELASARSEARRLSAAEQIRRDDHSPKLIGQSRAILDVLDMISRVAPSDASILITGENGTGKGVVAEAIHSTSLRSSGQMVTVNMGGMSEGVFESELFGHVKGAFTDAKSERMGRLELAEGGTLFLDEIANTPASQQAKLLRVLETTEYERVGSNRTRKADVRFVSATNSDLNKEVSEGRFRQDLLFRLNTVEIRIPSLRDRVEDIRHLSAFFLSRHAARYRKSVEGFHDSSIRLLEQHPWPGNVRELNHAIERAVLMCGGNEIGPADLGLSSGPDSTPSLDDMSLEEVEKYLIRRTLSRCDGNARQAAEALGLSRSAFYRRLERYGL